MTGEARVGSIKLEIPDDPRSSSEAYMIEGDRLWQAVL